MCLTGYTGNNCEVSQVVPPVDCTSSGQLAKAHQLLGVCDIDASGQVDPIECPQNQCGSMYRSYKTQCEPQGGIDDLIWSEFEQACTLQPTGPQPPQITAVNSADVEAVATGSTQP